jgi:bifunctional non-homologous end joining protein LigD
MKFDGYRMLARVDETEVSLFTRVGNDWTDKLQSLARRLKDQSLPSGWYDGEIVATDAKGVPNFGMLQRSFDNRRTDNIAYYLFDIPYLAGRDLRGIPLEERRAILARVFERISDDHIKFSQEFKGVPSEILGQACGMGLEGLIAKRRDSTYVLRRSADWIKPKCQPRQEMVIGGYTDPKRIAGGTWVLTSWCL